MDQRERNALSSLQLSWVATADDVWDSQCAMHVPGFNDAALDQVMAAFAQAGRGVDFSPVGVVVRGEAGSGKTHVLGQVRQRVQADAGFFFLVELLDATSFWKSARTGILESLGRPAVKGGTQLEDLLRCLSSIPSEVTPAERLAISGVGDLTPQILSKFVNALHKSIGEMVRQTHHTLRALVLLGASDRGTQDVGRAYLHSAEDLDDTGRRTWGIGVSTLTPQECVRDISRLVALAGPAVLAIEQIDTCLAESEAAMPVGATYFRDLEHVARGLMSIRQTMRRTAAVVACQPSVWESIGSRSIGTVADRFRVTASLKPLHDANIGRAMVERQFSASYQANGFVPPYPSWPIKAPTFDQAIGCTPRQLLESADAHVRRCLARNVIEELALLKPTASQAILSVSGHV